MESIHPNLNPTEEQKTFEMLQMGKEEFDHLERVRMYMRIIVAQQEAIRKEFNDNKQS